MSWVTTRALMYTIWLSEHFNEWKENNCVILYTTYYLLTYVTLED
jgi:hypothetical protein